MWKIAITMKKLSIALLFMVFQLITVCSIAQSVEVGYVKEYQGEEQKTPLSGVELRVVGAQSTVSDKNGRYELRFSVLKPGERIEYNDIYKQGYVIFNRETLEYWRISKDQSPFVIVMCKESVFRQLKMKYYDIIGNSYEEDYVRRLKDAQKKYADDFRKLDEEKRKIENDHKEKLRNIDNYAELFARIDHSEMDSIEAKALRLIDEGKIDEGIAAYEELHLVQQTEMQLDKWKSGKNMVTVGERMMNESEKELLPLVEKLKKQIALYEMGGASYDEKQENMILRLVDVYGELNGIMDGKFSEEMGQWLVKLANDAEDLESMERLLRRAANIPSVIGLYQLVDWYHMLIDRNEHFLDSAKLYTNKALQLTLNDSVKARFENMQYWTSDFAEQISTGDTLYFKLFSENSDSVAVWMKARYFSNNSTGTLQIPETVFHDGKTYKVSLIGSGSFYNNNHLKKVIIPEGVTDIYPQAFDLCKGLDTIVISKSIRYIRDKAIPYKTKIIMPQDLSNALWLGDIVPSWLDMMSKDSSLLFKYNDLKEMLVSAKQNKTTNASVRPYLDYWMGQLCWNNNDTIGAINHYEEASKDKGWGKELYYTIGGLYYLQKDFKKAYRYFVQTADEQHPWVYNSLAYMYAKGEYVKQSFSEAMKFVDLAILNATDTENLANFYDSKGEIFLMMGETDKAVEYWNMALQVYPEFNVESSDLYRELCKLQGKEHELGTENEFTDKSESRIHASKKQLQDYVDVARIAAHAEYSLINYTNASLFVIDVEELVAIGVIAVQVLVTDKTLEQLEKYNIIYVATAARWAIRNELRLRYKWYKLRNLDNEEDDEKMFDEANPEQQKLYIRASIYRTIYGMYEQLDNDDYGDVEEEISEMWGLINEAIEELPPKAKAITIDRIVSGLSFAELEEKYQESSQDLERLFNSSIVSIKEYLKLKDVKGF